MTSPFDSIRIMQHRWSWGRSEWEYREIDLRTPECRRWLMGKDPIAIVSYDTQRRTLVCTGSIAAEQIDTPPGNPPKVD